MTQLLVIKDKIRDIFRKYDKIFMIVLKFILALIVFSTLTKEIGYDERLAKRSITLILSAVSAFTPGAFMVFLASILSLAHIYAASKILAALFIIIIAILYFLFARFSPRYAWVIVAIPVLHKFHLAYMVPMILGLIGTPVASFAVIVGVVVTFLISLIKEAATIAAGTAFAADDILALYTYVIKSFTGNKKMIAMAAVFIIVLFITYIIRKLRIEHAFEIAIIGSTLLTIILSLVTGITFGRFDSTGAMILGTIASGIIAYVVQFFRFVLDYSATKKVQFEYDDIYYYVKAFPKLRVSSPEVNVKTISKADADEEEEETDSYEDGLEEPIDGADKDVF